VSRALLLAAVTPLLLVFLAGCGGAAENGAATGGGEPRQGDAVLAAAFEDHAVDLQVQGGGVVARVLGDDTEGGRHQRFIVRLATGQTLLVAHNIDIAPRVEDLNVGDTIAFKGVYEWSPEGGTVHWTHRDPEGTHAPGWLLFDGRTYQ
jgi:hypothetical protein